MINIKGNSNAWRLNSPDSAEIGEEGGHRPDEGIECRLKLVWL